MSQADRIALRARHVFPADGPPIADGVVVIEGDRIHSVGPASQLSADLDLGNVALLPGFANLHTHLDLSDAAGKCPPSNDFVGWLRKVIAHRRGQTPEDIDRAIAAGIDQLLRSGTTIVGDISADGSSWTRLTQAPMRSIVYHEILGLSQERGMTSLHAAEDWYERSLRADAPNTRPGFSPHAPYSVHRSVFQQFRDGLCTRKRQPPVAIHFMESAEEIELIERGCGPFVAFLRDMGVWEPDALIRRWDEIEQIDGLLVHGNFLDARTKLAQPLIYCPRTHAAFGHPPHPFRTLQTHRFGLGADSLASNPDLSILEEARFVARRRPDYDLAALLRTITLEGAMMLGWGSLAGSFTPGKSADLVVLPLPNREDADPHRLIFENDAWPLRTMFQGKWTSFLDS